MTRPTLVSVAANRNGLAAVLALAATLYACSSSSSSMDGAVDQAADATLDLAVLHPPNLACGADSGIVIDPCRHVVVCVDANGAVTPSARPLFAVTYYSGSCVAAQCTFTTPPTIEPCMNGCFGGPSGRCTRAGPTAP